MAISTNDTQVLAIPKKSENWDWNTKEKLVANINDWRKKFSAIRELVPSDDGEKIATIIKTEDKRFTTCVNGETWEETFERVYSLKFNPDNQLISLALRNYEWSVNVDHEKWEEKFDYIWNLTLSPDGKSIAVNMRTGEMTSGVCLNGKTWENNFPEVRDLVISPDGKRTASHVQKKTRAELDILGFLKKIWTAAVDGTAWDNTFLTLWGGVFSDDSNHLAAIVMTDMSQYTIAVDSTPWEQVFGAAWEPIFKPKSTDVIAPVQTPKGWTLALNGKPIWGNFSQVWRQKYSPDGQRLAAVVAVDVGKWTIAVDGSPWDTVFSQMVLSPVFSPDGKKVAASVKNHNKWTIAIEGTTWSESFDNIWDPVFSPDSNNVAARAEKNGRYFIVVNRKIGKKDYEWLWDPVFSPDGTKLLIRGVDGGKYYRRVIPISEI
jgi:hypothetical protein